MQTLHNSQLIQTSDKWINGLNVSVTIIARDKLWRLNYSYNRITQCV